jgi:hypothetical protein
MAGYKRGGGMMLKIIGIEIIVALAVLIWYEVLCVREKWANARRKR